MEQMALFAKKAGFSPLGYLFRNEVLWAEESAARDLTVLWINL
jgi:hypothetical protein